MANTNKSILRKNRIIGHRRKKNLCTKCGNILHPDECVESYQIVDNRPKEVIQKEKETLAEMKKTIELPKESKPMNDEFGIKVAEFLEKPLKYYKENGFPPMPPASEITGVLPMNAPTNISFTRVSDLYDQKIILNREYIILDISKSSKGNIVELSGVSQICQKYKDYIVCIFGNIETHFNIANIMKIRKLTNIHEAKFIGNITPVSYIMNCKLYMSYINKNIDICKTLKIPYHIFEENENVNKMKKLPNIGD